MRRLESLSFRFDGEKIFILDQTLLPQKKVWLEGTEPEKIISFIKNLQVRGAPLIGLAAAVCLARLAEKGLTDGRRVSEKEYRHVAALLRESRPTAVNLMVAIDRMTDFPVGSEVPVEKVVHCAENIFAEDEKMCAQIAQNGVGLIHNDFNVLTHCNTGGLATAGVGTAIGIIRLAHAQKKNLHVYVDETRPLLQGGRLTAWEMAELNIPHTLLCDSMAAVLMREAKVDVVIVGCDRIALNGDFANKIGTYNLAILAKYHRVPFYVAGPVTTVDFNCATGADIPIEDRPAKEVRGVSGGFGSVEWAPTDTPVFNPAFDVTTADLVSGWILDIGYFSNAKDLQKKFNDIKVKK